MTGVAAEGISFGLFATAEFRDGAECGILRDLVDAPAQIFTVADRRTVRIDVSVRSIAIRGPADGAFLDEPGILRALNQGSEGIGRAPWRGRIRATLRILSIENHACVEDEAAAFTEIRNGPILASALVFLADDSHALKLAVVPHPAPKTIGRWGRTELAEAMIA